MAAINHNEWQRQFLTLKKSTMGQLDKTEQKRLSKLMQEVDALKDPQAFLDRIEKQHDSLKEQVEKLSSEKTELEKHVKDIITQLNMKVMQPDLHLELCFNCGNKAEKLLQCPKCKITEYCSKQCFENHWKGGHKKVCALFLKNSQDRNSDALLASSAKTIMNELEHVRATSVSETAYAVIEKEKQELLDEKQKLLDEKQKLEDAKKESDGKAKLWHDVSVEREETIKKMKSELQALQTQNDKQQKTILELEMKEKVDIRLCSICQITDKDHTLVALGDVECGHMMCGPCAFAIIEKHNPVCPTCNNPLWRAVKSYTVHRGSMLQLIVASVC